MIADLTRVEAVDLGRNFGRRRALSHINLDCEAGEIVGLLGPNGAGKSTLLAILATLLAPSSGTVRYGGLTLGEAGPALRGRLGFLAHDLYLYPELTARENLTFFARLYDLPDPPTRVAEALEQASLTSRADDQVAGFSRGMRQRVALERALLHQPRLLLLDEPFTGLDQASTMALVARLRQLSSDRCVTILATHDLDVVDTLLTRVMYLQNGRVVGTERGGRGIRARYQQLIGVS